VSEVYRGNGFVVEEGDAGDLTISLEINDKVKLKLRANTVAFDDEMVLSYNNTNLEMTPLRTKTFKLHEPKQEEEV